MTSLRAALAALAITLAVTSCAPADTPTPTSPTPAATTPAATATETAPVPSATATTPAPTATETVEAPTAPSAKFADDVAFTLKGFGGIKPGDTFGDFAAASGWQHDGCCAPGNNFFVSPSPDAHWKLWTPLVVPDGKAANGDESDWPIKYFSLELSPLHRGDGPTGPVGPAGLRLGSPQNAVVEAFPDAKVRDYYFEFGDTTYRQYIVPAGHGTYMVIATVDGVIDQFRWGSTEFADGWDTLHSD